MGNVVSAGEGQAPADRQRSSPVCRPLLGDDDQQSMWLGLKTIMLAAQVIKAGDADLYVAAGWRA